jgi:hypothetical protein
MGEVEAPSPYPSPLSLTLTPSKQGVGVRGRGKWEKWDWAKERRRSESEGWQRWGGTSVQGQFRPPLYREELHVFGGPVGEVLLLHLPGSVSHPEDQKHRIHNR